MICFRNIEFWTLGLWGFLFAFISLVPFYYFQPIQFIINSSSVTFIKYFPLLLIVSLVLIFLTVYHKTHLSIFSVISLSPVLFAQFYLFICFLSVIFSAEYVKVGALKFVYYSLTGIFLPFLLFFQFRHKEIISRMIRWIVFIASIVAFYGVTAYMVGSDYFWGFLSSQHNLYYSGTTRASATLGNAIYAGAYLALFLPYAIWVFQIEKHSSWKKFYAVCIITIFIGLVYTYARGGWLASGIACGIYLCPKAKILFNKMKRFFNVKQFIVGFIIFLLMSPILEGLGGTELVTRTLRTFENRMDQSLNVAETESFRLAQYRTTWQILQDHALLGIGFGNFTRLFEKHKHPSTPPGDTSMTTENMYLMVTCETGLLGLIAFWGLLFSIVKILYIKYRKVPPGPSRDLVLASLASICGFMVNMATWDALNQPTVRMTFWMLVGLGMCLTYHVLGEQKTEKINDLL